MRTTISIFLFILWSCGNIDSTKENSTFSEKDTAALTSNDSLIETGVDSIVETKNYIASDSVIEFKNYCYADKNMFDVVRKLNGKLHGYQETYIDDHSYPKFCQYYINGIKQWSMFPSADLPFSLKHGKLLKSAILGEKVDSTYIHCGAGKSHSVWYRGLFIKNESGITVPVGEHEIYLNTGEQRWLIIYDSITDNMSMHKSPIKREEITRQNL